MIRLDRRDSPPESIRPPARRPQLVAIVGDDCTACGSCVDICLVDCIEPVPPSPPQPVAPVHIREDECIGCFLCAKVCEELEVNAIRLVPVDSLRADARNSRPVAGPHGATS